jgi:hypothetical protein
MRRPLAAIGMTLALTALSGCATERGDLEVSLVTPVASRFIVHGNCFAGWYVAVNLIVRETRGVEVVIQSVSLRVEESTGNLLGERMIDSTFLRDRFGEGGATVPERGSLVIPMSVGAVKGSVQAPEIDRSIVASGEVLAVDAQGSVRDQFRMTATVTIDDRPVPTAGACTPRTPQE